MEENNIENPQAEKKENKYLISIVFYLLWLGWIIAYVMYIGKGKKSKTEHNKFHLRQSLGIHLISIPVFIACYILAYIPLLGSFVNSILYLILFVMMAWGLFGASRGKKSYVPFIGKAIQQKLSKIG